MRIPPRPTGPMVAGLPTYTRAQWLQTKAAQKPGATFQKYRTFINNARGVVPGQPAWPGRGGPGLPTIESLIRNVQVETPAQVEARATRLTAANTAAQQGLANDQARRALEEAQRRMESSAAAGRAAAAMNQDLFGLVGGEYNRAATELGRLSTGGVTDVQAATDTNAATTNATLQGLGLPGISDRLGGPQQAAVADFRAGLGAQNLANAGESANFGLAGLISSQNLRAAQEAQAGFNQQSRDITDKQADALAEIARGRPETMQKYLSQLQDANRQQIALGSSLLEQRRAALQAGFAQKMTKAELKLKQRQQTQAEKQQKIANKAAAQELAAKLNEVNMEASAAKGYVVDMSGKPVLDANNHRIPYSQVASLAKGAKGKTMTPGQIADLMAKGQDTLKDLYYGFTADPKGKRVPITKYGGFDPNRPGTWWSVNGKPVTGRASYQQARNQLAMAMPGVNPVLVDAMLEQYYLPGERGRPVLTSEETKAARKVFGQAKLQTYLTYAKRLMERGQRDKDTRDQALEFINQIKAGNVPDNTGFRNAGALAG